jgi:hypothetical protein
MSFSLKNFQKLRHETDVNFEGAYISEMRRAKSKSNGCVESSTHWRTPRKQEK